MEINESSEQLGERERERSVAKARVKVAKSFGERDEKTGPRNCLAKRRDEGKRETDERMEKVKRNVARTPTRSIE